MTRWHKIILVLSVGLCAVILFASTGSAPLGAALVRQSASKAVNTNAGMTFGANTIAGSYIFVSLGAGVSGATVSDGKNTYTSVVSASNSTNGLYSNLFETHNTYSGALTITPSVGVGDFPVMCAVEMSLPASFGDNTDVTNSRNTTAAGANNGVSLALTMPDLVIATVQHNHSGVLSDILMPVLMAATIHGDDACAIGYFQASAAMTVYAGFRQLTSETDSQVLAAGFY